MATLELAVRLTAGVLLILANGFFVAIEFALTRVRQYPEEEFQAPALRRGWEMTEELEIYLTSCQIGITASSIALGVVAEPALSSLFHPLFEGTALAALGAGGVLAFLLINLVHLTHGEQTPTYLGVERSKFVVRYGALPLYLFTLAVKPAIHVGDSVAKWTLGLFGVEMTRSWTESEGSDEQAPATRGELRRQMGQALSGLGVSGERQREVIRAFEIGEMTVEEVMVPRDEIVALRTTDPLEKNLQRIQRSRYVRFPLVDGELEAYRGNVYTPSILEELDRLRRGETTLSEIAAPPVTVDRQAVISEVIDRFQEENQELALVVDGDEVVGLVTATDAFETIIGELKDPLDVEDDA